MANPGCSDGSVQGPRAANNIIERFKLGIHFTAAKDGQELVWLISKISSKRARLIVLITTCCYVVGRRLGCFYLKPYKNWQVITDWVVDHAATTTFSSCRNCVFLRARVSLYIHMESQVHPENSARKSKDSGTMSCSSASRKWRFKFELVSPSLKDDTDSSSTVHLQTVWLGVNGHFTINGLVLFGSNTINNDTKNLNWSHVRVRVRRVRVLTYRLNFAFRSQISGPFQWSILPQTLHLLPHAGEPSSLFIGWIFFSRICIWAFVIGSYFCQVNVRDGHSISRLSLEGPLPC